MSLGPLAATALAAAPAISDNTWVGQTLVLTPGSPGATEDWMECPPGLPCIDTLDTTDTYPAPPAMGPNPGLTGADVGDTLEVVETPAGGGLPTTSAPTPVITAGQPTPTSLPAIQAPNPLDQGATVTVLNHATWTQTPDAYVDQWQNCSGSACSNITGATAATYQVGRADAGDTIELVESPVYGPTTVTPGSSSAPTTAVIPTAPTAAAAPQITGSAAEDQSLTASPGGWTNSPDAYAYQWLRCDATVSTCVGVSGATGSRYTLGSDDLGSRLEVQVVAFIASTSSLPQTSAPTAVVSGPLPANLTPPTIAGNAEQDQSLNAFSGTWTNGPLPGAYTYQWQACGVLGTGCTAIAGAVARTYTPTAADVGHTLVVSVTAANSSGTSAAVLSTATGVVTTPSSVSLTSSPGSAVVNQGVTLVATVTASSAAGRPAGTLAFTNGARGISGCADQAVSATGQSATIICQTTFAAQQAQLGATFTPSAGSEVLGSASTNLVLAIGRDVSATSVDVTSGVKVGARTTYTATVATPVSRLGPLQPSGSVAFLDRGAPIAACARQPLTNGGATCAVSYAKRGTHTISARYLGDANFSGSSSSARPVRIVAISARGRITATMQWTFHYTPGYTNVVAMVINGLPTGASLQLQCHGTGCPFAKRSATVAKPKPCSTKGKGKGKGKGKTVCPVPGSFSLTPAFAGHKLHVGAAITILIRRPMFVGKYYRFTVRARRQPRVQIACLALGSNRPGKGC